MAERQEEVRLVNDRDASVTVIVGILGADSSLESRIRDAVEMALACSMIDCKVKFKHYDKLKRQHVTAPPLPRQKTEPPLVSQPVTEPPRQEVQQKVPPDDGIADGLASIKERLNCLERGMDDPYGLGVMIASLRSFGSELERELERARLENAAVGGPFSKWKARLELIQRQLKEHMELFWRCGAVQLRLQDKLDLEKRVADLGAGSAKDGHEGENIEVEDAEASVPPQRKRKHRGKRPKKLSKGWGEAIHPQNI